MLDNYPVKIKKQHEHYNFTPKDYIETSRETFFNDIDHNSSISVEEELGGSINGMRRDFKRTTKKLLKLYSDREQNNTKYEFARPHKVRLVRGHVTG